MSVMNAPEAPKQGKEMPKPKASREEEILGVIKVYASDLREITRKLREKLN